MKPFTRKQLEERLHLSPEETTIVMTYQKTFPELLTEEKGFAVNARTLWKELGEPRGQFSKWIRERMLTQTQGKDSTELAYTEEKDYLIFVNENEEWVAKNVYLETQGIEELDSKRLSQLGCAIEYMLTTDCAKKCCMMENTHAGFLCKEYFILMEKVVHDMVQWEQVRHPEKEGYKEMCKALEDFYLQKNGKKPQPRDYAIEANTINMICLGAKASDIQEWLETKDKITRDHLTIEYNQYLYEIQKLNILFLKLKYDTEVRHKMLKESFQVTFPQAQVFLESYQLYKKEKENS